MRFLALGDSYTIGEGVGPGERWPSQLSLSLRLEGIPLADPEIIARTGWTAGELAAAVREREPRGPFALVTLLIGVNNQYRGLPVKEFASELRALLCTATALGGGDPSRVVVLSIPDWGVTPFAFGRDRAGIAAEIDRFNAVTAAACLEAGIPFVDVTGISRTATRDESLLTTDGLHPSGAMYRLWVEAVILAIKHTLGTGPPAHQPRPADQRPGQAERKGFDARPRIE